MGLGDWQIMTAVDMRDADAFAHICCTFEFLSATSIVVGQQGVLEVFEIRIETPGAPPVHTASLCMPRPNLDEYRSTLQITANPRVSQCIDHGNPSDCSPFPSPSFPLAEDNYYLTIHWGVYHSAERLEGRFHVPLSSLRCSSMYGDALVIPWETWSKGFYFQNDLGGSYGISGGRLICITHSIDLGLHCHVSVFDLNQSRASRLGMTSADPRTDYARFHPIKSDLWPGEIRMERPHPVHLASRSFCLAMPLTPHAWSVMMST
ncbi:hypothetical protein BS47DRAFT_88289 [Hydnum rufescens UP504]|uniref:Uncharacterized protein n=1 Tax=Hydnum rufescens UP504 TaxID=1448309 RepID=A0A9P6AT19_9AGAM|nr:hypothetical protein BS47DRAFT_88289 [Hydnum rufescens UP504]